MGSFLFLFFTDKQTNYDAQTLSKIGCAPFNMDSVFHSFEAEIFLNLIEFIEVMHPDLKIKNKENILNIKYNNMEKTKMSLKIFVWFFVKQFILLFFFKFLFVMIYSLNLIGGHCFSPVQSGFLLISILLLIYALFLRYLFLKTYDIPVFFSCFLIVNSFPVFLLANQKNFFYLLPFWGFQEFSNTFFFMTGFSFLQQDIIITEEQREFLSPRMNNLGKIFLFIFLVSIIINLFALKEKKNKLNGFLFVLPNLISLLVTFYVIFSKKLEAIFVYNIYYSDPNLKIIKITREIPKLFTEKKEVEEFEIFEIFEPPVEEELKKKKSYNTPFSVGQDKFVITYVEILDNLKEEELIK